MTSPIPQRRSRGCGLGSAALAVSHAPALDNLAVSAHDTGTQTITANRVNHVPTPARRAARAS